MLRLALLASKCTPVLAAFNFSLYPVCAQKYLYADTPSQCDYGNTADDLTKVEDLCLCSNSAFLNAVSQQVFVYCGCEELTAMANMAIGICESCQAVPLYSARQLITIGDGGACPCVIQSNSPQATTTPTSSAGGTPTSSSNASSPPLPAPTTESAAMTSPPTTMATSTGSTSSSLAATPSVDPSASSNNEQVGLAKESNRIALGCGPGGIGAMIVVDVLGYVFRERVKDVVRGQAWRIRCCSASFSMIVAESRVVGFGSYQSKIRKNLSFNVHF
jgi:hypothetical protein